MKVPHDSWSPVFGSASTNRNVMALSPATWLRIVARTDHHAARKPVTRTWGGADPRAAEQVSPRGQFLSVVSGRASSAVRRHRARLEFLGQAEVLHPVQGQLSVLVGSHRPEGVRPRAQPNPVRVPADACQVVRVDGQLAVRLPDRPSSRMAGLGMRRRKAGQRPRGAGPPRSARDSFVARGSHGRVV